MTSTKVWSTPRTRPTARRLLASLPEDLPVVVNWTGAPHTPRWDEEDSVLLNGNSRTNKLEQLNALASAGVLTPQFAESDPDFPLIAPVPGWMGRTLFHTRAGDFRFRPRPAYWVEPLLLSEEWRLHVFKRPLGALVVIRSAIKKPIEGAKAHPWVRSHATGWRFSYVGGSSEAMRTAARNAVGALGLDFGAVDLGIFCGTPVVLEVNTCPSLERGSQTLAAYAREIERRAESDA